MPHIAIDQDQLPTKERNNHVKIAIIGAGPGGLILARLLHIQNIACTIFEREESINNRSQGGTLDLRSNTGLAAIKTAQLWDKFQENARYDSESLLVTDKKYTTWLRRSPGKPNPEGKAKLQEAPEIDRIILRQMLLESLPEGTVQWGMKLSKIQDAENGTHALHFANGQISTDYDLIVGCDGAFSATRKLLSSEQPYYTGLAGWAMEIPDAHVKAPETYKRVNKGNIFAYSDGKAITLQQLSSGSIWVSAFSTAPEQIAQAYGDIADVRDSIKAQYPEWAPELVGPLDEEEGNVSWVPLYVLPVGFTWPHKKGITLLGDAAHLMSPFSGIGVNTAFYDALLLSRRIGDFVDSKQDTVNGLDGFIVEYEKEMLELGHKAQAHSEGSMKDMMFTPGAPRKTIEPWLIRLAKDDLPAWSHPLLTAVVYIGYGIYKLFI